MIWKKNANIRWLLNVPAILAFFPADDVFDLWQIRKQRLEDETDLGNHKPAILEFYKYFENNYVGHKTETRVETFFKDYKKSIYYNIDK
jgi:hypothetical protein